MKLEKWAHIAEIIGGAAIVVPLVVLILEVRQSRFVQEHQNQITRYLNTTDHYLDPAATLEVYAKVKAVDGLEPLAEAYVERYSLTPSEAVLWSRLVQRTLFLWQSDYALAGATDGLETALRIIPIYPDLLLAYEINEDDILTPEFRAYVDSVLEGG